MVMNDNDSSWVSVRMQEAISIIESEHTRPSVVFKAKLATLSDRWCAYVGEGKFCPIGVMSDRTVFYTTGSTPDEAMRNFDKAWVGGKT